jgi:hypothetical protein
MKKALFALTAIVPIALVPAWTAKANPAESSLVRLSQSSIEQIGCKGGPSPEDRCPYGYRLEGGGRGYCAPCSGKRYGSKYRDRDEEYYEPRRYREYDERSYGPRRYRDYDDGYYEPRRYREY